MSKTKRRYYMVVSANDKRKVPTKHFGAFEFTPEGKKKAQEWADKNSSKINKLIVKAN